LPDPLERAAGWSALAEDLLDGLVPGPDFLRTADRALGREPDELVVQRILGLVESAFWRFSPAAARAGLAPELEAILWRELDRAATPGRKAAYFRALASVTLSSEGRARLEQIWRTRRPPAGLPLAEEQYTDLAEGLAVRDPARAAAILDEAERRITNPDRLDRFRFVRRALAADPAVRDSVFASFRDPAVRRRESWVLEANGYLHHPLRAAEALKYVRPSLDLLEEVKRTGDIFFPTGWIISTLGGHNSAAAADLVSRFLAERPDLAPRLRAKLLQSADELFRAARAVDGWAGATGSVSPRSRP
jgi:aminopeptidase N